MTKYIISGLVFIAVLAGVLLYVGDDATLTLTSSAQAGLLAHPPLQLTWQAVILLGTALMIGTVLLWSLLLWLWRLPRRLKSGVGMRRRNRAIDAMEEALIAGAEGDMARARTASAQVRKLAGSTSLGHIISATAAEACGDRDEAIVHYGAMLDDPKTRPTAQRGLAQAKLATGDIPGAVEAAKEAFDQNPKARWAFDTLFKALVADFRWTEARDVLERGQAAKHLERDVLRRRRAVLLAAEADYFMDSEQHDKALELSHASLKNAPDFAPAAAIAAHEMTRAGSPKKAQSLLEKAWQSSPHPALAVAFLDLYPGEADGTRQKRIEKLITLNPTHRESKLLVISHNLRAGRAVEAWSALSKLLEDETATARLCLLASEAEDKLGNEADARLWVERAATAPHEADWADLDPDGPGFDYTAQDWRRLVFSYGDTGVLEHPRAERQAPLRRPVPQRWADAPANVEDKAADKPGVARSFDEAADPELAERLDKLIDGDSA